MNELFELILIWRIKISNKNQPENINSLFEKYSTEHNKIMASALDTINQQQNLTQSQEKQDDILSTDSSLKDMQFAQDRHEENLQQFKQNYFECENRLISELINKAMPQINQPFMTIGELYKILTDVLDVTLPGINETMIQQIFEPFFEILNIPNNPEFLININWIKGLVDKNPTNNKRQFYWLYPIKNETDALMTLYLNQYFPRQYSVFKNIFNNNQTMLYLAFNKIRANQKKIDAKEDGAGNLIGFNDDMLNWLILAALSAINFHDNEKDFHWLFSQIEAYKSDKKEFYTHFSLGFLKYYELVKSQPDLVLDAKMLYRSSSEDIGEDLKLFMDLLIDCSHSGLCNIAIDIFNWSMHYLDMDTNQEVEFFSEQQDYKNERCKIYELLAYFGAKPNVILEQVMKNFKIPKSEKHDFNITKWLFTILSRLNAKSEHTKIKEEDIVKFYIKITQRFLQIDLTEDFAKKVEIQEFQCFSYNIFEDMPNQFNRLQNLLKNCSLTKEQVFCIMFNSLNVYQYDRKDRETYILELFLKELSKLEGLQNTLQEYSAKYHNFSKTLIDYIIEHRDKKLNVYNINWGIKSYPSAIEKAEKKYGSEIETDALCLVCKYDRNDLAELLLKLRIGDGQQKTDGFAQHLTNDDGALAMVAVACKKKLGTKKENLENIVITAAKAFVREYRNHYSQKCCLFRTSDLKNKLWYRLSQVNFNLIDGNMQKINYPIAYAIMKAVRNHLRQPREISLWGRSLKNLNGRNRTAKVMDSLYDNKDSGTLKWYEIVAKIYEKTQKTENKNQIGYQNSELTTSQNKV